MSDPSEAEVRARLLALLNHDLRAPLARIAAQAADPAPSLHIIEESARRQLEWLSDVQECARFELQAPELALAPAYVYSLLLQVEHAGEPLPPLALLDARRLAQVLRKLCEHTATPVSLRATLDGGMLTLRFRSGAGSGAWEDVPASLGDDGVVPGLALAAHLVRAMGGRLLHSAGGLRFEIAVEAADEDDAMPPAPRFALPPPFGAGHAVLLLERHDAMRDYLAEILDSAGFDVLTEAGGERPALALCADETIWESVRRETAPPVLLHAMLPPRRPQDYAEILYKPAPPELLLAAARRLLDISLANVRR